MVYYNKINNLNVSTNINHHKNYIELTTRSNARYFHLVMNRVYKYRINRVYKYHVAEDFNHTKLLIYHISCWEHEFMITTVIE